MTFSMKLTPKMESMLWGAVGGAAALAIIGFTFGGDTFPYGIDENRPTWEQMLRYSYEQGIAHRHAKPEEIFPKGIMTSIKV